MKGCNFGEDTTNGCDTIVEEGLGVAVSIEKKVGAGLALQHGSFIFSIVLTAVFPKTCVIMAREATRSELLPATISNGQSTGQVQRRDTGQRSGTGTA